MSISGKFWGALVALCIATPMASLPAAAQQGQKPNIILSLNIGTLDARDADLAPRTFAAAQTAKQQCINTCRARYRDCRRKKQIPSFECQNVYQDCTRYTCTGLGPG